MFNEDGELERICFNCCSFFPAADFPTEEGICFEDGSFEPYIEELIDNNNFDCCKDLINRTKFNGERDACKDFEPVEVMEINDEISEKLRKLVDNGNATAESLREELLAAAMENLDFKNHPVESYLELLQSNNRDDVMSGINSLGALSVQGNDKAFIALCEYYKKLPPAHKLSDVHFRIDVLQNLSSYDRQEVVDCLVNELYKTPSNNTTRSLILEIFKIMETIPLDLKKAELEKMMHDKRFSYRLKNKMKAMLVEDYF